MRTIHIHADAPDKPDEGAPCNGCGICCLSEPCPLGVVVSRRRHGACAALRWDQAGGLYRCGMLPRSPRAWWQRSWKRLALRWISAGAGCDCNLQVARTARATMAQSADLTQATKK